MLQAHRLLSRRGAAFRTLLRRSPPTDPAATAGDEQAHGPPSPAPADPPRHPSPDTPSGATVPAAPVTAVLPMTSTNTVPIRALGPSSSSTPVSEEWQLVTRPKRQIRFHVRVPLNRRLRRLHPVFQIELARNSAASTISLLLCPRSRRHRSKSGTHRTVQNEALPAPGTAACTSNGGSNLSFPVCIGLAAHNAAR